MTDKQILRYLQLIDRRLDIALHSGVDWKPEYGPEIIQIEKELTELRRLVDQAHGEEEVRQEEIRNKKGEREHAGE